MKLHIFAAAVAGMAMQAPAMTPTDNAFDYKVDRFADIEVLRYRVPDFENLTLQQKQLVYHLTEAALWGRDILWDQNGRYNLPIRRMLESVYTSYTGDRNDQQFKDFELYLKQLWFASITTIRWTNSRPVSAVSGLRIR